MGLCFSKKKASSRDSHASKAIPNETKVEKPSRAAVESAAVKKEAVVIIQNARKSASESAACDEKVKDKKGETPTKKVDRKVETCGADPVLVVPVVEEFRPTAVVRSSSCTKEEVDAILIQCGRLSRSSSGNASNGNGGGHMKYSGSKRSYDFDSEKKAEEEEEEEPVSRPSPHRRTPGRERSGSRERGGGGGGGRKVSRSPGRRTEVPASPVTTSERSRQPAKMVAVPARDKGRGVSPAAPNKRGRETGAVRSASPQPRSPASTARISNENASYRAPPPNQPQSLSRSSSRKAEQSPYRRSPMKEVDENVLSRTNQNVNKKIRGGGEEGTQKLSQPRTQKLSENGAQGSKGFQKNGAAKALTNAVKSSNPVTDCVREQLMGCRGRDAAAAAAEEDTEKASAKVEVQNPRTITRTRSSRRSSRDLDHALGLNQEEALLNPNPNASLLLEDIRNQHPGAAFSLPACVSKAFSIVDAVADLNSSSSENRSYAGDRFSHNNGSLDGRHGRRGLATEQPFVESEIVAKDDLLEPSLHRYVTMTDLGGDGGDVEPQESAGSNSVVGQPWASPWEPNSVDSTDQCWTSRSNNGDEVEQEARLSSSSYGGLYQWQQPQESETRVRRMPWGGSSENKRDFYRRTLLHPAGAKTGGGHRSCCSLPVSAAAAATT